MNIRKHSRILAFALALVMILPLISIPAFADGVLFDGGEPTEEQELLYSLDFEGDEYKVGSAPAAGDDKPLKSVGHDGAVISDAYGSKSLKFDYKVGAAGDTASPGDLNKDRSQSLNVPEISYADHPSIVYEIDYLFTSGCTGQIQTQLLNPTSPAAGSPHGWVDLFIIKLANGKGEIAREGGGAVGTPLSENTLKLGVWNTVSVVINMLTAKMDFYINGVKVFENVTIKSVIPNNLTITANNLVVSKVNKQIGSGSVVMDNIRIHSGTKITAQEKPVKLYEDFEDYIYGVGGRASGISTPKLATFERSGETIACRLPLAPSKGFDTYTLISTDSALTVYAEGIEWDGHSKQLVLDTKEAGIEVFDLVRDDKNGFYYTTDDVWGDLLQSGERYYLVPDAVAEIARGSGGQIATASKFFVPTYTYADEEGHQVVLSADYYLENGSKGIIESQFEDYYYNDGTGDKKANAFMQLFTIDAATGKLSVDSGALNEDESFLNIGQWNNVKLAFDLKTGNYQIYLNDTLVANKSVGKTNLSICKDAASTWSVAKIQRTKNFESELSGAIWFDNIKSARGPVADEYEESDKYLTEAAEAKAFHKILNTFSETTVRFENPKGLRFITEVNDEALETLKGMGYIVAEQGTIIAPYNFVLEAGNFTKESLDQLGNDVNYLDVEYLESFEGADGVTVGEGTFMSASVVDIPESDFDTDIAGIGYITVKNGGKTFTLYSRTYAVANLRDLSARLVANAIGSDAWTEKQLEILGGFSGNFTVDADPGNINNPISIIKKNTAILVEDIAYVTMTFPGRVITVTCVDGDEDFAILVDGEELDGNVIELTDANTKPYTFAIKGNGTYNVNAEYPLGAAMNPALLPLAPETVVELDTYIDGGYLYHWTPEVSGLLEIGLTGDVDCDLIVTAPKVQGFGEKKLSDATGGTLSINAVAGTRYAVKLVVTDGEAETAELRLSSSFIAGLTNLSGQLTVEGTMSLSIAESLYGAKNELTVTGPTGFAIVYNGTTYPDVDGTVAILISGEAIRFDVVGTGAEYTYLFDYPVGTVNKPKAVDSSKTGTVSTELSLAENDADGYYFKWTNPYTDLPGTVTFDIANITDGVTAKINVDAALNPVTDGTKVTVSVAAGGSVVFQVLVDEASGSRAAADITFTNTFIASLNKDVKANVTIDGTAAYRAENVGVKFVMTVIGAMGFKVFYGDDEISDTDGVVTLTVDKVLANFKLEGNGTYEISFDYELGSIDKPESLTAEKDVATEKTFTLAAGDEDGYYFNVTNPYELEGIMKLVFTNGAAAKAYLVTDSDSVEITADGVIVDAGKEVKLQILATDPANATEVALSLTFGYAPGTEYNPIDLGDATSYENLVAGKYYKLTNLGKTYNFDFTGITPTEFPQVRISVNGEAATSNTSVTLDAASAPTITFVIIGSGNTASFATEAAVGSKDNPAELTIKATNWKTDNVTTYYFVYNAATAGTIGVLKGASSAARFQLTVTRRGTGEVVFGPQIINVSSSTQKVTFDLDAPGEYLFEFTIMTSSNEVSTEAKTLQLKTWWTAAS